MIEIKPNCLYSRTDLAGMLEPLKIDVDTFTARLKPRKVFRQCWLGADILKAFEAAPALAERDECGGGGAAVLEALATIPTAPGRSRAAGSRPTAPPAGALKALRQELRKDLR